MGNAACHGACHAASSKPDEEEPLVQLFVADGGVGDQLAKSEFSPLDEREQSDPDAKGADPVVKEFAVTKEVPESDQITPEQDQAASPAIIQEDVEEQKAPDPPETFPEVPAGDDTKVSTVEADSSSAQDAVEALQQIQSELDALEAQAEDVAGKLQRHELTPGQARTELAQVEAAAKTVEGDKVDAIKTSELSSGKEEAKTEKKQQLSRLERLFERVEAIFKLIKEAEEHGNEKGPKDSAPSGKKVSGGAKQKAKTPKKAPAKKPAEAEEKQQVKADSQQPAETKDAGEAPKQEGKTFTFKERKKIWDKMPSAEREAKSEEIHAAAKAGDMSALTKLLDAGLIANSADGGGITAMHIAAQAGHAKIIEALLAAGGNSASVTKTANMTPLHFAAKHARKEAVEVLVPRSTLNMKDKNGKTAADVAKGDVKDWLSGDPANTPPPWKT